MTLARGVSAQLQHPNTTANHHVLALYPTCRYNPITLIKLDNYLPVMGLYRSQFYGNCHNRIAEESVGVSLLEGEEVLSIHGNKLFWEPPTPSHDALTHSRTHSQAGRQSVHSPSTHTHTAHSPKQPKTVTTKETNKRTNFGTNELRNERTNFGTNEQTLERTNERIDCTNFCRFLYIVHPPISGCRILSLETCKSHWQLRSRSFIASFHSKFVASKVRCCSPPKFVGQSVVGR